ncbi:unnamed protein product [Effrenium voratum]|nr:unnamed protein product [Effrenium voratum]
MLLPLKMSTHLTCVGHKLGLHAFNICMQDPNLCTGRAWRRRICGKVLDGNSGWQHVALLSELAKVRRFCAQRGVHVPKQPVSKLLGRCSSCSRSEEVSRQ